MFSIPSSAGRSRIAVIVPRYGHIAVDRNRVRRRLVEIARTIWMPVLFTEQQELDVILKANPMAYGVSYKRLQESLVEPRETICAR